MSDGMNVTQDVTLRQAAIASDGTIFPHDFPNRGAAVADRHAHGERPSDYVRFTRWYAFDLEDEPVGEDRQDDNLATPDIRIQLQF